MYILELKGIEGMSMFHPERDRAYFYKISSDLMKVRQFAIKEDRDHWYRSFETEVMSIEDARKKYRSLLDQGYV
jgi:hypothetical protein